ncbi:shikimate dehydrogenase [Cerasicoccus maritimus]|uniref:shikimate dehydrogenase n=1 Tax=Cerasicoccus maritimus TaxID=490089 RepID=UPI002852C4B5|nr:shikimate dehydrogenase [Cerasicoccus maritimus]
MQYDDPDRVRSLDELEHWDFQGSSLAVLGSPIGHSVSPAMHNAALNLMGQTQHIFADWRYFKFDTPPEILPQALEQLHRAGFQGVNLTIPHKVQAVDLVVEIDPGAKLSGAVNTLHRREHGWAGFNSDGYGLEQALLRELSVELTDATVIMLGAGGAARAAAVQCLQSGVAELWIGNRNQERLGGLIDLLQEAPNSERVRGFDLSQPPADLPKHAVIVNATSLGLKAEDPAPIDLTTFESETKVYDMTYGVENALAKAAKEQGIAYADGLSMLVWQGVRSLEIWSGAEVPAQAMMDGACFAKGYSPRRA